MDDGTVFATETRSLSFSFHKDGSLIIDFNSILKTKQESVTLDGDPQHAGFQFRASTKLQSRVQIIPITYALMKAETKMELQKIGRKIKK